MSSDIGYNEMHVTTLQYSVPFLVFLTVFNYIFDPLVIQVFSYFWAIVFVIDYYLIHKFSQINIEK